MLNDTSDEVRRDTRSQVRAPVGRAGGKSNPVPLTVRSPQAALMRLDDADLAGEPIFVRFVPKELHEVQLRVHFRRFCDFALGVTKLLGHR